MKVVLIKSQGKYMLYWGDDCFASIIEPNDMSTGYIPSWAKKYKYRAQVSGHTVYFNINNAR